MSQAGGNAYFESLDDKSLKFMVQYNPKEFQVNKALTWEESKTQGVSANPVQFQKGAPMTASFDLMFDTTNETAAVNVQDVWVNGLLALTNPDSKAKTGEEAELGKTRPHALMFTWGAFKMKCVVESINVTYLMFASSGEAIRARCQVKLKEWVPPKESGQTFTAGAGGSSWGKGTIVLVGSGQTLSQLAESAGSDMRTVAAVNSITDPMADHTGQAITIPGK